MRSPAVVIFEIARERSLQVSSIQHDDVIQTLPSNRSDDSLRVEVLPGTFGRDQHFFDAHVIHPLLEVGPIHFIPVAKKILGGGVIWKGLDDLLCGPFSRWMLGHIEMDDSAPMMGEHDQDGEGGWLGCTRYLSTVDWATSIPSFPSSPTIRGEPQSGLAFEIRRIRSRTSMGTFGLPGLLLWLSLRQ